MENNPTAFIQQNSPDGALKHTLQGKDFLQSDEWKKFQESVGRKTYSISGDDFHANILEHTLPIVGKYFYVPRGPVMEISNDKFQISNQILNPNDKIKENILEIINLAKKENAGWIRVEPVTDEILNVIRSNTSSKIAKAPHDMQPKELFVIDITKPEERLLAEMKSKTRYNIKLSQKRGVSVKVISNDKYPISNQIPSPNDKDWGYYVNEFIKLTAIMAKRQGIEAHPGSYYQKMLEIIPGDILKLYIAEYEGKIVCANLMVFYGQTCTYLHGASDDQYRNVMAPFLLQWQQIHDAKAVGCERYDFGGVKINSIGGKSWVGVTRFKTGFSPDTKSTEFPGCYDIVISATRYRMYKIIQRIKSIVK